jgi:hypothetical protein
MEGYQHLDVIGDCKVSNCALRFLPTEDYDFQPCEFVDERLRVRGRFENLMGSRILVLCFSGNALGNDIPEQNVLPCKSGLVERRAHIPGGRIGVVTRYEKGADGLWAWAL